jgi:hypothetical protein
VNLRDRLLNSLGAILLVFFAVIGFRTSPAQTGNPVPDLVQVDLDALIDAAAKDRNRFSSAITNRT